MNESATAPTPGAPDKKKPRVFYGWWIVAACFSLSFYIGGTITYSFSSLVDPLVRQFGHYAEVSLIASLRGLETGLLSPVVGFLVDKLGPRKILAIGAVIASSALFLMQFINSLFLLYAIFILLALGNSFLTGTPTLTAVANWFKRKIGIANGIMLSGLGLSGLMVPFVTGMIDTQGWQKAMQWIGVGLIIVIIPCIFVMRHKPEQYGMLPDGDPAPPKPAVDAAVSKQPTGSAEDMPLKKAWKMRPFWHLTFAGLMQNILITAIFTHLIPYLTGPDCRIVGLSRSQAAFIFGAIPVVSVIGRLGAGWLGDRFNIRKTIAAGYGCLALGVLFLSLIPWLGWWALIPFVPAMSIGYGSIVTLNAAIIRKYFGVKNFGTIFGGMIAISLVGGVASPWIAGKVFDTWQTYSWLWPAYVVLGAAGAVALFTMPNLRTNTAEKSPTV
uniref:MFS transporter n=1 Tax=uncultured Dehalococcoidia bacterium TaxID=498747 RepID=A0A871Y7G8_9CHLR|nr:MFS transporter [uncultured Dehalococcoidia bacterium]